MVQVKKRIFNHLPSLSPGTQIPSLRLINQPLSKKSHQNVAKAHKGAFALSTYRVALPMMLRFC
jgi:hypothetical protein